ncbi:hypothetical protein L228DRAFT_45951 [Xylona heveae TC161]|uniref:Uncharacterized protein n=1 Tax=Xylona heveae (strain CBS 132557 / TC161) TaxID=1328760 RepID=A0A164ZGN7_XYLHT|nr:hypothetical protein L228DRAFT_45951 [Xylona heveae TC161]KZF19083.1 hypothetical protein L228DRAFT_45951 [Xylona heveae TC161]
MNHASTPADLCTSFKSLDLFSLQMREFSYRLASFELTAGQISAELFWPQNRGEGCSHISWPALKSFKLTTQGDTADGQWMIERDMNRSRRKSFAERDESTDEEGGPGRVFGWHDARSYRQKPRQDWFDNFNLAVAHAAQCMPLLETMVIRVDQKYCDDSEKRYGAHTFTFKSGGAGEAKTDTGNPRVEWAGGSKYEPAEDIQNLWQAKIGSGLEIDIVAYFHGPRKLKPGDLNGWVRFRNGQKIEYDDSIDT